MKRTVTLLLTLALLLACLPGCERKKDLPVTTVVTETGEQQELPLVTMLIDSGTLIELDHISRFVATVPGQDREFHLEYQVLDGSGTLHDQNLQRVRTEILAGKGPDIFLCECFYSATSALREDDSEWWGKGALFNFPQAAMDRRMFLPLDSYMENAQYTDFTQLDPVIFAAGRNGESQQLLPLTFDFGAAFYVPEAYGMPEDPPATRQEMMDSGCPALEYSVKAGGTWHDRLLDFFPQVIDWEHELPAFTEEELLDRAMECWEALHTDWGMGPGWIWRQYEDAAEWMNRTEDAGSIAMFLLETHPREDAVLVPEYNRDGGVTAYIRSFAAINRNASYPDYAFTVVDHLLSRSTVRSGHIYGCRSYQPAQGMTLYTGETWGDSVFPGGSLPSQERYKAYRHMLDQINSVRFYSTIDQEMLRTVMPVVQDGGATREDIAEAVHQAYMAMKMMLAES